MCSDVSAAIGNTPLVRLRKASERTGCTILGKCEFMNPGGSVKDRAALYIVLDAERRGVLRKGGLIVEGTAGNTGIGLALVGRARGYRTRIVIPETQSQEKKDMLRLCGAELVEVPAVPFRDPNHYVHVAERLAEELADEEPEGVLYANQWDNRANRQGHYETTGPEIWRQTGGRVDGFVSAIGTGGTLSGVGAYLKEQREGRRGARRPDGRRHVLLVQARRPRGARAARSPRASGRGASPATSRARASTRPPDPRRRGAPLLFELLDEEGICVGGSSAINLAGAIRLARDLGPGHTIVTLLCDHGSRYATKLWAAR